MIYQSGAAFRQALEEHIRNTYQQQGTPISRIRKLIVFERFLARLVKVAPHNWSLKGGLSLELRLGTYARSTKDMDFLIPEEEEHIYDLLFESSKLNLQDFFEFNIHKPQPGNANLITGKRYFAESRLDGRTFEQFHLDVGGEDILLEAPDFLPMPSYLSFAGVETILVPCYPIAQQIAEKYHAATKEYRSGVSSRVKDMVDILLLASHSVPSCRKLRTSITNTFSLRDTHKLPDQVIEIDPSYQQSFSSLAEQVSLPLTRIDDANAALLSFLHPVLFSEKELTWNPHTFTWEE